MTVPVLVTTSPLSVRILQSTRTSVMSSRLVIFRLLSFLHSLPVDPVSPLIGPVLNVSSSTKPTRVRIHMPALRPIPRQPPILRLTYVHHVEALFRLRWAASRLSLNSRPRRSGMTDWTRLTRKTNVPTVTLRLIRVNRWADFPTMVCMTPFGLNLSKDIYDGNQLIAAWARLHS